MKTKLTFEEYLRKDNLSKNTITSYLWTVNYFNANYDVVRQRKSACLQRVFDGIL